MSKRTKNQYTDEEIIEDVKKVIEETGDSSLKNYKKVSNKYSLCAIQGHFGSWTQLLRMIGVEPEIQYFATKEDLIKDAKRVIEETGKSGRENYLKHGKYSRAIIKRIFGTWNNLLNELGYEINMFKPGQYTKEDVLNNYKDLCIEHQKLLTAQEFRKLGKFSQPIIDNIFGSFSNLRKELRLHVFIKKYSDEDIERILWQIYNKYGFVNQRLINETRLNNVTIINKYGSIKKCCQKFNIPYDPVHESMLQKEMAIKIEALLGADYEKEKIFDWLKNPKTGMNLKIDIYYDKLKLAIEIAGSQHDKFCPKFHKNEEEFLKEVERDRIKDLLLQEHGISVIRIKEKNKKPLNKILKDYIN